MKEKKSWSQRTDVLVLDVASGLAFKFCLGMRFLSEMLDEHFLHGNKKSRVSWERWEIRGGERRRTVAKVMTKAALLEHIWTSGSWLMIFLTLDTEKRRDC